MSKAFLRSKEIATVYSFKLIALNMSFKKSVIVPNDKSGNLMDKTNWRPITILNTFGKLLEKIIHFQTCIYLKLNEILSDDQHGFRKEHSTSSAVMEFLIDIYDSKLGQTKKIVVFRYPYRP